MVAVTWLANDSAQNVAYIVILCTCSLVNIGNATHILTGLSLKYNQQDATFSRSIYFYKLLYMFRFSAHHQEHKTVHTASGIVKPILLPAAIVDEMELHGVSSHPRYQQYWFDNT